jgi:replicative DNA helicase
MPTELVKRERKMVMPDIDIQGRILPQSIGFEEAVLGAMMLEPNATGAVIDKLSADMFYKEAHKFIFEAIHQVFEKGDPVDLLSITAQLRKNRKLESIGGSYYLATLTNKVVSSANIEFHARNITEKHILRSLISAATVIINESFDDTNDPIEVLDRAEKSLFDITEQTFRRTNESMSVLLKKFTDEMKEAINNDEKLRGLPSGFTRLDDVTGGWQKSNLIILAARPSMGKTAFVLSMARNMAVELKKPVAFFSLEMSAADLTMRLVSAETGIRNDKLRQANLSNAELGELVEKLTNLADALLYIDDTPALSVFELRAKCRRLKQQHNIECVIVDYLQLMRGSGDMKFNREQEISNISRSLKTLSKELNIPVIALSQLSRAPELRGGATGHKRPQLSDLRESGAIEQDADLVLFIYRPEYYKLDFEDDTSSAGLADLIIAKNRNGRTGDIRLRFIADQAKFCDHNVDNFSSISDPYDNINTSTDTQTVSYITRSSRINDIALEDIPY